jgi:hypothetical protein
MSSCDQETASLRIVRRTSLWLACATAVCLAGLAATGLPSAADRHESSDSIATQRGAENTIGEGKLRHLREARANSKEIELFRIGSVRLIGKYVRGFNGKNLVRDEQMMKTLGSLPNIIPGSFVGWVGDYQPDGTAIYMFGVFAPPGTPCPEGFVFKDISAELSSNVIAKGAYGEGSCMPIVRAFETLGYGSPYCGMEAYGWWEGELYLEGESLDSYSVLMPVRPNGRKLE